MKVVILSTYDLKGGAAIAAYRLARALKKHTELDVHLLVKEKTAADDFVIQSRSGFISKLQNKLDEVWERFLFMRQEKAPSVRFQFSIANTGQRISEHPLVKSADIIHLHWINQGFISLSEIGRLQNMKKVVVWTLHDMWAFTGGEHYSNMEHYLKEAGFSEMLKNPGPNDLSHELWQRKKHIYQNLDFITCSEWLRDMASRSSLLKPFNVTAIPNAIDVNYFKRGPNKERSNDKINVLFGAFNIHDPRKGFKFLADAINRLDSPEKIQLLIAGKSDGLEEFNLNCSHVQQGNIPAMEMPQLYSKADVMVVPSLQDNLPNTIMEAMACECPVIAFKTGGIPEMVDHEVNGFLVDVGSSEALAAAIQRFLNLNDKSTFGLKAREKVLEAYSEEKVAKLHLDHYQKLVYE